MRHHYHKVLQAKLIGELAKDLRTLRTPEIEKELNLAKPGN
jgi:protein required for attachment to host cells